MKRFARGMQWAMQSLMLSLIVLSACSGGGETGTGFSDTGQDSNQSKTVVVGALANIGGDTIVVNGNAYDTGTSSIVVGNTSGSESDLAVGMVVEVGVEEDETSHQATATVIAFENEVEGIVLANDYPDSLDVMGQVVIVNNDTVFESHVSVVASIKDIRKRDHVEISGFPTEDGAIYATHVVVKADTAADNQIIVKGNLAALSADEHLFTLGNLRISYLDSSFAGGITALKNGMPVKVVGHLGFKGNNNEVLFADQIFPLLNSGFQFAGTQIEIEGIAATDLLVDEFSMRHLHVIATEVTAVVGGELSDIKRGKKLKVSGVIDNRGKLVADAIVFMRLSTITLTAPIEEIDYTKKTITIFGKTFYVNADTGLRYRDISSMDVLHSLTDYSVGDPVEVKAYRDASAMGYIATRLDAGISGTAFIMGQIDDVQNTMLTMKDIVIDVSRLPPGQFMPVDIGRRVALTIDYISGAAVLSASAYEYVD